MANDDISAREPDPLAEKLKARADDANQLGPTFVGFFTHGDEPGYERLYFSVGAYVEFRTEHVVTYADVPADLSPVLGERATAIRLAPDTPVDHVREQSTDDFDLNLRVHKLPTTLPDVLELAHRIIFGGLAGSSYPQFCKNC